MTLRKKQKVGEWELDCAITSTKDAETGIQGCSIVGNGNAMTGNYGLAYVRQSGTAGPCPNARADHAIAIARYQGTADGGDRGLAVAGLPHEGPTGSGKRYAATCEQGIAIAGQFGAAETNWGGIAIVGFGGQVRINYFGNEQPARGLVIALDHGRGEPIARFQVSSRMD